MSKYSNSINVSLSPASRLASNLYTSGTNLSRSVSSAGERQSDTYVSPLLPKRAETFGGFDNPTKDQVIPVAKGKALIVGFFCDFVVLHSHSFYLKKKSGTTFLLL